MAFNSYEEIAKVQSILDFQQIALPGQPSVKSHLQRLLLSEKAPKNPYQHEKS